MVTGKTDFFHSDDQLQPGSFFQRPREAEKRDPGNEVGSGRVLFDQGLNFRNLRMSNGRVFSTRPDRSCSFTA